MRCEGGRHVESHFVRVMEGRGGEMLLIDSVALWQPGHRLCCAAALLMERLALADMFMLVFVA